MYFCIGKQDGILGEGGTLDSALKDAMACAEDIIVDNKISGDIFFIKGEKLRVTYEPAKIVEIPGAELGAKSAQKKPANKK